MIIHSVNVIYRIILSPWVDLDTRLEGFWQFWKSAFCGDLLLGMC